MFYITKEVTFDAAHNLTSYHGKCERLHGHTYRLQVTIKGEPDEEGMVIDFVELKKLIKERILNKLDHSYINDLIPQPTAEYIARWVFDELEPLVKAEKRELFEIVLWETPTSFVRYRKE